MARQSEIAALRIAVSNAQTVYATDAAFMTAGVSPDMDMRRTFTGSMLARLSIYANAGKRASTLRQHYAETRHSFMPETLSGFLATFADTEGVMNVTTDTATPDTEQTACESDSLYQTMRTGLDTTPETAQHCPVCGVRVQNSGPYCSAFGVYCADHMRNDVDTDTDATEAVTEGEADSMEHMREAAEKLAKKYGCDVHIPTLQPVSGYISVLRTSTSGYLQSRFFLTLSETLAYEESYRQYAENVGSVPTFYGMYAALATTDISNGQSVLLSGPDDIALTTVERTYHAERLRFSDALFTLLSEHQENAVCAALVKATQYTDTRYTARVDTYAVGYEVAEYGPAVNEAGNARKASYLDVTPEGNFAYLPASKYPTDRYSNGFTAAGRQTAKPTRVARMVLTSPDRFTDSDYEGFTNIVRGFARSMSGTFERVTGPDIAYWYSEEQYASDGLTGTLAHSCMRYGYCADYFGIYVNNPDKISLLIYTNERNELLGRALLWQQDNGSVYMDRVYGSDAIQAAFQQYATKQGYNGSPDRVTLNNACYSAYPYMDTMRYLHAQYGVIGPDRHAMPDQNYSVLDDTDGGPDLSYGYLLQTCWHCGGAEPVENLAEDDSGYAVCLDCASEMTCQACGSITHGRYDLTHGYCESCIDDYRCTECGELCESGTEDGYCSECAENKRCTQCQSVHYSVSETQRTCTPCLDSTCQTCGKYRDYADRWQSEFRGSTRNGRMCADCQRQCPELFSLTTMYSGNYASLLHTEDMQNWRATMPYTVRCDINSAAQQTRLTPSLADVLAETPEREDTVLAFADTLESAYFGSMRYRYLPLCEMPMR